VFESNLLDFFFWIWLKIDNLYHSINLSFQTISSRRLQCFHLFHNECIEDWFLSISLKCPDCPICRTLLNVNSLKMFGLCTNTDEMESKSFCSFDSYQSARARSVRAAEPALAQAQAPTQAPARVPARAPTNAVRSPIMTRSRSRILEQARNRRTRSNHRRANSINII
ncbi:hypothetical protein SSS_10382, partial [Sarcoptes scabiei]